MTKLEFIDKINDILIGLNTAESDALGSLYDELMRDAGWHPASESPELGEDDDNEFIVIASVDNELYRHGPMIDKPKKAMFIDGQWTEPNVKWWIAPPEKE